MFVLYQGRTNTETFVVPRFFLIDQASLSDVLHL